MLLPVVRAVEVNRCLESLVRALGTRRLRSGQQFGCFRFRHGLELAGDVQILPQVLARADTADERADGL